MISFELSDGTKVTCEKCRCETKPVPGKMNTLADGTKRQAFTVGMFLCDEHKAYLSKMSPALGDGSSLTGTV